MFIAGGAMGTEEKFKENNYHDDYINFHTCVFLLFSYMLIYQHRTWSDSQDVVVRSDTPIPQAPRAHVAALVGLACVVDCDALLQAG